MLSKEDKCKYHNRIAIALPIMLVVFFIISFKIVFPLTDGIKGMQTKSAPALMYDTICFCLEMCVWPVSYASIAAWFWFVFVAPPFDKTWKEKAKDGFRNDDSWVFMPLMIIGVSAAIVLVIWLLYTFEFLWGFLFIPAVIIAFTGRK